MFTQFPTGGVRSFYEMRRPVGKLLGKVGFLIALTAVTALFIGNPSPVAAQFSNKITTTPVYIQDGFGLAGDSLPYDGLEYCFPTTTSMLMSYLGVNGFNQIGPSSPTSADGLNLTRVMAGLMRTDPITGTGSNPGVAGAIQIYLSAKGISASNYSLISLSSPTISALANLNQGQTVVELGCGYYIPSGGTYSRSGGHALALLSQGVNALGQPSANTLVINNPLPSTFVPDADISINSLQYLNTVSTTGSLTANGSLELDPNQYPSLWGDARDVVETAFALTINPSQQSANNPTPAVWTLASAQAINIQNGNLTVLAPMQGPGGINKGDSGTGTLELEAPNSTSGPNVVSNGTLRSDVASGLPFGTGAIQLQAATLQLMPVGGTANVSLTIGSGTGNQLSFLHGTSLALSRNGNTSLSLTIGGNTDGTTANIVRNAGTNGTLVIVPANGVAALGLSERVIVNGTGGNLPALSNGIVAPYFVAEDNDSNGSGDFLTYGAGGFAKASYTQASTTSLVSAGSNTVFEVNVAQTVPSNMTAQVYALKVGPLLLGGGVSSTLKVGSQGEYAGVILDGGTIGATNLSFGSAEGLIFTSRAGGTISSTIQGSGGLTTFGPGSLTLTAANTYTGVTNINSGTLVAANTSGSATGSGAVTVQQNATLQVSGFRATAGGAGGTTVNYGASLWLSGGSMAGPLTMNFGSHLFGQGTITGAVAIYGTIGSTTTDPAATPYNGVDHIRFANSATSILSTIYSWRLDSLDDAPADAGTNWSLLDFLTSGATLGNQSRPFHLALDFGPGAADPASGNAFWTQPHQWLAADTAYQFSSIWYTFDAPIYSRGSFSARFDSGYHNLYVEYTPSVIDGQWAVNGGGTWGAAANWTSGNLPGASPDTALFSQVLTSGTASVTLDGSRSLSSLGFSTTGGASYAITPSNASTLTLSNTAGSATISVSGGNDTIAVPIFLGSNLNVSATSGSVLTISAAISGSGGIRSLSLSGDGELILSGSNTYSGGTIVMDGKLDILQSLALPEGSSLTVGAGATLIFGASWSGSLVSDSAAAVAVPEPGMLALLVAGVTLLGLYRRRRFRSNRDRTGFR